MPCFEAPPRQWIGAVLLAGALVLLARRKSWLRPGGQAAAFLLGVWVFGLGGLRWSLGLVVFFLTSSVLTRWRSSGEKGGRAARQVLANGLVPAVSLGLCPWWGHGTTWVLYHAALAAAAADTWATEIGRRSPGWPRSLRTGRPVAPGTSGAVSLWGLAASLLAASLMGGLAGLLAPGLQGGPVAAAVTLAGFLGGLVDSVLGAFLQGRVQCTRCGNVFEAGTPHPCPGPYRPVQGLPWLTNDAVNLLSNLTAALLAALGFQKGF